MEAGGEDVADEEHLLVLQRVGDHGGRAVGEGDAEALGVAAAEAAPARAGAEDAAAAAALRRADAATVADAAGDDRGADDAVAGDEGAHRLADLLDHADVLVAADEVGLGGDHAVAEVDVAAADRRRGDADDDVGRFGEARLGGIDQSDRGVIADLQGQHVRMLVDIPAR
ncbi:MAG TPA: hypothetical protein VJ204_20090 [Solirubrobacterales bacterium]|nr:hypothetical protein [Solirubrobacterales bacterium]